MNSSILYYIDSSLNIYIQTETRTASSLDTLYIRRRVRDKYIKINVNKKNK